MMTEFHGDSVAGGTFPALIWKTFAQSALRAKNEPPELFPAPMYESAAPYEVVYRNNRWLLDNGNCQDAHEVMYVSGFAPEREASCKRNEVDVPRVVGASLEDAKARLASTPLEAQVVTRPAKAGERIGYVVAQFPARGTLSAYDTVRLLIPRALHGVVPDLVGLDDRPGQSQAPAERAGSDRQGIRGRRARRRPRPDPGTGNRGWARHDDQACRRARLRKREPASP